MMVAEEFEVARDFLDKYAAMSDVMGVRRVLTAETAEGMQQTMMPAVISVILPLMD